MTWATSVPILVFLGLSVLDLGPMYATDIRQTDVRRASSLNASALWGGSIIIIIVTYTKNYFTHHLPNNLPYFPVNGFSPNWVRRAV